MKVYVVTQWDGQSSSILRVASTREVAQAWMDGRKVCPHPAGYHPPAWAPQYTLEACTEAQARLVDGEMEIDEWDVDEGPTS